MSTKVRLKKTPAIEVSFSREAGLHRRPKHDRTEIDAILNRFEKRPTSDPRDMAEIIEYDELGLPK